tara:strand:+ start:4491 stop:6815 length:2325 start_codon:yes stop_codon:yes gene_type:complete
MAFRGIQSTNIISTEVGLTDPILVLNKDGSTAVDVGFLGKIGSTSYAGLVKDSSTEDFLLIKTISMDSSSTNDIDATDLSLVKGDLQVGTLTGDVTGDVTGQVSDISNFNTDSLSEGSTNLYFTNVIADARVNLQTGVNLDLSGKSTSNLPEGTNLYYTNARTDARVNLQVGTNLDLSGKSTSNLPEGTNLYYTDARADARAQLKIDATVDSAPGTLDTLNELAAALGDDANFSTTVTNSIAAKLPLAGGTMTGDLIMDANEIHLADNGEIRLGNAADYKIYHDGSNSYIKNDTGWLNMPIGGHGVSIANSDFSKNIATFKRDGACELYYDGSKKIETNSTGINVPGTVSIASTTGIAINSGSDVDHDIINLEGITGGGKLIWDHSATGLYWNKNLSITGNVGIGATTNLTSKLTVNAPAASHTTGYQEDIAQFYTTASSYLGRHYLNMFHDNNNRDSSGDHTVWGMGFGYDGNTRGGIQYDHKGQERLTLWSSYGDIHIKGNSSGSAGLRADQVDTTIMTLKGNGNVGIGTEPGAKLTVSGPASSVNLGGGSTGSAALYVNSTSGHVGEMIQVLKNGAIKMYMANDGKLGLGTSSPTRELDVNGSVRFSVNTDNHDTYIFTTGAVDDGKMYIQDANSVNKVVLNTNGDSYFDGGNFGIGITSPTEKLHVSGNILASGDITAYSDDSLKTNVQVIDNAVGKVEQLRGVTFDRIEDGSTSTGVIAQELKEVLPEAVHTDEQGVHSVAYGNVVGLLIEAIKEQQKQIDELIKANKS